MTGTFGREATPLPVATRRVLLSGLTASAVGYQPTGMNPSTTETDSRFFLASSEIVFEISSATTLLLSEFATNSVLPSGETARPTGVLPSGDCGYSEVEMTSRVPSQSRRAGLGSAPGFSRSFVGMTCTVLSPAQATNNLPSGATVMSFGRSPTVMSRTRLFLSVSTALTLLLPQLLTYKWRLSAPIAQEWGNWPTALVRRDHQLERHVTDGHLIACGRDAPAVKQQVLIRLQSSLPADCRAIDVLSALADRIKIGRRTKFGAGESDCNCGKRPGRQR